MTSLYSGKQSADHVLVIEQVDDTRWPLRHRNGISRRAQQMQKTQRGTLLHRINRFSVQYKQRHDKTRVAHQPLSHCTIFIILNTNNDKLCMWQHPMPPPLSSQCGRRSALRRRADCHSCRRQRSSSFPRSICSHADRCSCLCINAAVSKPAWWPWPLSLKVSSESHGLPVCQFWSS